MSGEALSDEVRTRIPIRVVHPAAVVPAFTPGSGSLMWPASRGRRHDTGLGGLDSHLLRHCGFLVCEMRKSGRARE